MMNSDAYSLLELEDLASELHALKPRFDGNSTLEQFLRKLDECGLLRPERRLILPPDYLNWCARQNPDTPEGMTDDGTLAAILDAIGPPPRRVPSGRDWARALFSGSQPPPQLVPYIAPSDVEVSWTAWLHVDPSAPFTPTRRAFNFYRPHQWLSAWAHLEDHVAILLVHPGVGDRELVERLWPSPSHESRFSPQRRLAASISYTDGGRLVVLAGGLEENGWLRELYQVRHILHRTQMPAALFFESDGTGPRTETDASALRNRLLQELADRTLWQRGDVETKLTGLVEVALRAQETGAAQVAKRLAEDLRLAFFWADRLYGLSFADVNTRIRVHTRARPDSHAGDVLHPGWATAERHSKLMCRIVPDIIGKWSTDLTLTDADFRAFLAFLEGESLTTFTTALWELDKEKNNPSDLSPERLTFSMLALAASVEPILDALADGNPGARVPGKRSGSLRSKVMFFLRGDWRGRLSQMLAERWDALTQIPPRQQRSPGWWNDRMEELNALEQRGVLTGPASAILSYAFVRNALAHFMDPAATVESGWFGRAQWACVYVPWFFWKLARG